MSHSPAPWKIIRSSEYTDDPEDTTIQSIQAANGKTVYFTDSGYFKPEEEDAALIESAPDLLALAKVAADHLELEFLKLADKYAGTKWENDPAYIVVKKQAKDARVLIAKAERRAT